MSLIHDFFAEIDDQWPHEGSKTRLSIIGCGALMLQIDYERGTKDGDVFETLDLSAEIKTQLVALAGPGSKLHARRKLYIDIVKNGIPFLPHVPRWNPVRFDDELHHFEVVALDVVDVVVSKLKRFSANDQADIDAMVARELVQHHHLIERFRSAVDNWLGDAREVDLPKYVDNLHRRARHAWCRRDRDRAAVVDLTWYLVRHGHPRNDARDVPGVRRGARLPARPDDRSAR
ncbi:MAG TPA: DUF6036 family nucleotidyltransferase [Kofleriaceae bacterium]|jgi:hypothetical protein